MNFKKSPICFIFIFLIALNAGCTSNLVRVSSVPIGEYKVLAKVQGKACGALILGFIPIRLNGRVARAHQNALSTVSGATKLINVTVSDDWYWWVIGQSYCFTVSGEAI